MQLKPGASANFSGELNSATKLKLFMIILNFLSETQFIFILNQTK